jgi:hypothetical protein
MDQKLLLSFNADQKTWATILLSRWIIYYSPQLEEFFRKNHKRLISSSYRAVDKYEKIIDFKLSEKRHKKAGFSVFQKCMGHNGMPDTVAIDDKAGIDLVNFQLGLFFMLTGIFLCKRMQKYVLRIN